MKANGLEPVDAAIVLAMDCSGSISSLNLALQVQGYAHAIASDGFIRTVRTGRHGKIAMTVMKWSDNQHNDQAVPWMCIDSMTAAARFAAALLESPNGMPMFTSISGAIDKAVRLLSSTGFVPSRYIIDVSGDGPNNDGRSVTAARDAAVAKKITINGLPIVSREPDIATYYAENVIGGPASFIETVENADSFPGALRRKLVTEIASPGHVAGMLA